MVKLKSFKYTEAEMAEDRQVALQEVTNNNTSTQQQQPSNSTSSSQSISSITGGALTSESGTANNDHQEAKISYNKENENENEEEVTTLSSNEEYQIARVDLKDEEDSCEDGNQHTKIYIDNSSSATSFKNQQQVQPTTVQQVIPLSPKTQPLSSRLQQQQQHSQPGSPQIVGSFYNRQSPHPMSPGKTRYGGAAASSAAAATSGGDNVSQYSFGHQMRLNNHQASNHFEIQWRNINLVARKSKLPKLIEDNPIYKFFKGKDKNENKAPEMYYSPPIQHKLFNIHPTISENVELESKLSTTAAATATTTTNQQQIAAANQYAENLTATTTTTTALNNLVNGGDSNYTSEFRPILSNISGSVFSGQLTAILGPSGVGKTMLLNSLTGRNTLDGTGRVNLIYGGKSKRMSVVTVPQVDVLPAKLTTIEDLRFTSRLKNTQKGFNHERNIERLVKYLQIEKFLHTRIDKLSGGEARRLSICRELLSSPDIMILDEPTSGLDANTCKKIITALRDIVEHSDNILDRPMSIIVTIHQPQQEVLNLFHRVYVVALGGRAIYEGPPSNLLPSLLEQSSLSKVCKVDQLNENPAIVALEVASGEYGPNIITELSTYHANKIYEDSLYNYGADGEAAGSSPYSTPLSIRKLRKSPRSISPRFELLRKAKMNSMDTVSLGKPTPILSRRQQQQQQFKQQQSDQISSVTSLSYDSTLDADLPEQVSRLKVDKRLRRSVVMKSDFLSHTMTLIERSWLLTTRDSFLMSIRIIGFLLVAGGMIQIFGPALNPNEHQCPNYETNIDDLISFMDVTKNRLINLTSTLKQASSTHLFFFHLVLCITMVTSALTGLVVPMQMRMFLREYKNGMYSPASFITSQTLAELPVDILGPTICILLVYPLCNQPESLYHWREIGYLIIIILSSIICKSQAQIVGAFLMDSVENSVFISCVMVTPPALLSGIAVRLREMNLLLRLAASYSPVAFLRYTFESLFMLRFGYSICKCDEDLVQGWPVTMTQNSMPPQLERLAEGFLELSLPQNVNKTSLEYFNNSTTNKSSLSGLGLGESVNNSQGSLLIQDDNKNLFLKFARLMTEASNQFPLEPSLLGNCDSYRSLYLLQMDIDDDYLPRWISVLILMFILSRFLTYICVKLVIKFKRNRRSENY